jgi:hypothetical protein
MRRMFLGLDNSEYMKLVPIVKPETMKSQRYLVFSDGKCLVERLNPEMYISSGMFLQAKRFAKDFKIYHL